MEKVASSPSSRLLLNGTDTSDDTPLVPYMRKNWGSLVSHPYLAISLCIIHIQNKKPWREVDLFWALGSRAKSANKDQVKQNWKGEWMEAKGLALFSPGHSSTEHFCFSFTHLSLLFYAFAD
jgi:hypothetical protein